MHARPASTYACTTFVHGEYTCNSCKKIILKPKACTYCTTKHFFLWDRSTIYDARVSSAPFRDCDHTNLGTSVLCDVGRRRGDMNNVNMKNPSIYQEKVLAEYKAQVGSVPPFLKQQGKKRLQSDLRQDIPTKSRIG